MAPVGPSIVAVRWHCDPRAGGRPEQAEWRGVAAACSVEPFLVHGRGGATPLSHSRSEMGLAKAYEAQRSNRSSRSLQHSDT